MGSPDRDPTYYHEDGDCIILVEGTLFKIHRFLLTRGSCVFRDMFSLGSCGTVQGTTDASPILLPDAISDIRTLFWGLYASPSDITAQSSPYGTDYLRLCRLTKIVNKYQFEELEKWATDVLTDPRVGLSTYLRITCPLEDLNIFLEAASLSNSKKLRKVIEDQTSERIIDSVGREVLPILNAVEKYGSRRLQGVAYYFLLMYLDELPLQWTPNSTAPLFPSVADGLSQTQRYRLFLGQWSLSKFWDRCCAEFPIDLPLVSACHEKSHESCKVAWEATWDTLRIEADRTYPRKLDIVSKLLYMNAHGPGGKLDSGVHMPKHAICRAISPGPADSLLDELSRTMPDHFLGPLPSE